MITTASSDETLRSVGKLNNIQVMRFVAAAFVVLYHAWVYLGYFVGKSPLLEMFNGQWGFYGVAMFFAISGFLMSNLLRTMDCWTFILHRIGRIYPAYYLVCLVSIGILSSYPWHAGYDAFALSLLPAGAHPSPLGIEWTLVFELSFYGLLFFVSLLGLAPYLPWVATLWLVAILLTTWFVPEWQNTVNLPVQTLLLSSMNIGFVGGLLLPSLMERAELWPFALLIGAPLALLSLRVDLHSMRWMGGLAVVLAVGTAAQLPQIRGANLASRLLVRLGDWSYVTYLVHPSIMWIVYQSRQYHHPLRAWAASLAAIYLVTVAVGPLDLLLYRRVREIIEALSQAGRLITASVYMAAFTIGCAAAAFLVVT